MSNWFKVSAVAGLALIASGAAQALDLGLGRVAESDEIAAWNIDVRPDGLGLPAGEGTYDQGEEVFLEKCASCHGEFGEGAGRWPVLAGGAGTLTSDNPEKTIGSYWPYASTVYDYIYRAMPFGEAQSLAPDEVYSIMAYLFVMNDIADVDWVASADSVGSFVMPNVNGFIPDDREVVSGERCMSNCKENVAIASRARVLDVTPERGMGD